MSFRRDRAVSPRSPQRAAHTGVNPHSFVVTEYLVRKDGRSHNETLKAGDFFGEEVMLDNKQYCATVLALQTTVCFKLDRATFENTIGNATAKWINGSDNVG